MMKAAKLKPLSGDELLCLFCDYVAPTEIHLLSHVAGTHPKEWAEAE